MSFELIRKRCSDGGIEPFFSVREWDRDEDWFRSHLESLHDSEPFAAVSWGKMGSP